MKPLNKKLEAAKARLEEAQENLKALRKAAETKGSSQSSIGGVIREFREKKGMTLRDLSRKAGVGFGMLYGLEMQPRHNPTYNNLLRIASGLDLTLSELISEVETRRAALGPEPVEAPRLTHTGRLKRNPPAC